MHLYMSMSKPSVHHASRQPKHAAEVERSLLSTQSALQSIMCDIITLGKRHVSSQKVGHRLHGGEHTTPVPVSQQVRMHTPVLGSFTLEQQLAASGAALLPTALAHPRGHTHIVLHHFGTPHRTDSRSQPHTGTSCGCSHDSTQSYACTAHMYGLFSGSRPPMPWAGRELSPDASILMTNSKRREVTLRSLPKKTPPRSGLKKRSAMASVNASF